MNKEDNAVCNPRINAHGREHASQSFATICGRRYSRRDVLKGSLAVSFAGLASCQRLDYPTASNITADDQAESNYNFVEIEHGLDQYHHVAPDHQAQILIRWGDPLFADAPEFDLQRQSVKSQLQQFGYNNDFIGYIDLTTKPGQRSRALLCINHEYPLPGLMFPGYADNQDASAEQMAIAQAAVGCTIMEVGLQDDQWEVDLNSKYNRRLTMLDTEFAVSGPAAGHQRLQTRADPLGQKIIGTMANCAGGITPWRSYLSCEENIDYQFGGTLPPEHKEANNHKRMGIPNDYFRWAQHDSRFDIGVDPNEANRFGWVVEIDPLDPKSTPIKRTALGRFKHEGGENVVAADGRLVVYMGDDQKFEYLYKFVSRDKVDTINLSANWNLLDHGTLYVAKFFADGRLEWRALNLENKKLKSQFASQADLLIETRRAADLLQATPMDRPEDVVPNAETGKVYVMLTNNSSRSEAGPGNPRAENVFGHIIEVSEDSENFSSTTASWDVLVQCGDPQNAEHNAQWNAQTSANGWFASPDNAVVDPQGRLWVASDQSVKTSLSGTNDGLWALETEGPLRGTGKMFFRVPMGAEMCGPMFSDDGENLFLSVQHPGDTNSGGVTRIETATTRWPDFDPAIPPRPSVVVVRRKGGGKVG